MVQGPRETGKRPDRCSLEKQSGRGGTLPRHLGKGVGQWGYISMGEGGFHEEQGASAAVMPASLWRIVSSGAKKPLPFTLVLSAFCYSHETSH